MITGSSESVTVGVDHLAVTFKGTGLGQVRAWASALLEGEFEKVDRAMLSYRSMAVGPLGAKLLWDNNTAKYDGDVHMILPGKACRSLELEEMRDVFGHIADKSGRCSRIDLAADDYTRRITPTQFRDERNGDTVVTMTRRGRFHIDDNTRGSTFYVGSRSSRVMLRVYDKAIESKGVIDAVRFELEIKKEAAAHVQRELKDAHWGEVWASHLVKLIDFRDRSVDSNVNRCPRIEWFESLVGDAKRAGPYMAIMPRTFKETVSYMTRQWGPTLAAALTASGGDLAVVYDLLHAGRRAWKPKHEEAVARWRKELGW